MADFESEQNWNEKTTENKNEFFVAVATRNNLKIVKEEPPKELKGTKLKKTKSQSQLAQSTASLVGISDQELSFLTAQLGSGGRLKKQSSIRNVFTVDALVQEEEEANQTPTEDELMTFTSSSLSFARAEDEGRVKLKKCTKMALLYLLVDPSGYDVDFETTFFFTFTLFMTREELLVFIAEWLGLDLESRIERKSCHKSHPVKKKTKHLLTYWVRLVPEDFLDGAEGKTRLSQVNSLLASLDSTPVTPIPNWTFSNMAGGSLSAGRSLSGGGKGSLSAGASAPDVGSMAEANMLVTPISPISSPTHSERPYNHGNLSPRGESQTKNTSLPGSSSQPASTTSAKQPRRKSLSLKKRTTTRKGTWGSTDSTAPLTLFRWSPLMIAQQLTAIAWRWFERVGPREWLSGSWGGEDMDEEMVPGVFNLVADFNFTHNWAANEIVQSYDLTQRTALLELIIDVLGECVGLKNYHTAMSLISAVLSTPVDRLSKTWKGLSNRCKKNFQTSKDLLSMDNNFCSLRNATYSASTPLLPYVGLTMGDITGIRQTNIVSGDSILFEQLDVMARVIAHVRHCQTNPYNCRVTGDFVGLLGKNVILDKKALYGRSKEIEKGEKKEDSAATSPSPSGDRRKSVSVVFTASSPLKKEKGEPEEGEGAPKVLTPLFASNPYSNRFTPSQLTAMLNFLDKCEEKPTLESEGFQELREKVGKTGQGGILLSKGVIYSWLVYQYDSTSL